MADYKEMYLDLLNASEKAIQILIEAQQTAEERYISKSDQVLLIQSKEQEE